MKINIQVDFATTREEQHHVGVIKSMVAFLERHITETNEENSVKIETEQ